MFNYWALKEKGLKDEDESQLLAKVCIMSHDLDYDKKYFL